MKKHSVQIIGTYLEDLKDLLLDRGIQVESVINKINPITLGYMSDESKQHFCDEGIDACGCLDIRKNLSSMLSHNVGTFSTNVSETGFNVDSRKVNTSDYIIIYNSYINSKLLFDNGVLYTYRLPANKFVKEIAEKENTVREFTFLNTINWKLYFDNFISLILKEYDSNHIILLRNSIGPWYVNENGLELFDKDFSEYRKFVEEMDQYFLEKTKCICIDDFYLSVSDRNPKCIAPPSLRSREDFEYIVDKIVEIIKLQDIGEEGQKINLQIKKQQRIRESLAEFYLKVKKSEVFSDTDFKKVEKYTIKQVCDIQDIIAVYYLYQKYSKQYNFDTVIRNIVMKNSEILEKECSFFEKNWNYLKSYPYISKQLLETIKYDNAKEVYYLRLPYQYYLKLTVGDNIGIELLGCNKKVSFADISSNNMICSAIYMEQICGNLSFYLDRAREGFGNIPFRVCFSDEETFIATLYYINYARVLENEQFLLEIDGENLSYKEYKVRTDLSFLFKENVRIFFITNGLGDQIRYYLFSKMVTNENMHVYYDDIYTSRCRWETTDINKIIKEDITNRRFSKIFSPMLLEKNFSNVWESVDVLFQAGLNDIISVCVADEHYGSDEDVFFREIKKSPKLLFKGKDFRRILEVSSRIQYLGHLPHLIYIEDLYKKYIEFPSFDTVENINLANEMLSCDAVVLHVRRGDFITLGRDTDISFYRKYMQKLKNIPDYPNKKFYVFSDDIPWCREHMWELGFSIFEDPVIRFVDYNTYEQVYRDMQLIMYGKIIIGSSSGMVRMAVCLSNNVEIFVSPIPSVIEERAQYGFKNKYDMEI